MNKLLVISNLIAMVISNDINSLLDNFSIDIDNIFSNGKTQINFYNLSNCNFSEYTYEMTCKIHYSVKPIKKLISSIKANVNFHIYSVRYEKSTL
jgi:hypothetical protein